MKCTPFQATGVFTSPLNADPYRQWIIGNRNTLPIGLGEVKFLFDDEMWGKYHYFFDKQ
ncbi:hypothetical protein [Xenorhabdus sp. TH1]|uniref:hypothetical protein n=1 Tax=Xenorhabdus sp. TH1 TaxID=3130166 RepID=UPI0030CC23CB